VAGSKNSMLAESRRDEVRISRSPFLVKGPGIGLLGAAPRMKLQENGNDMVKEVLLFLTAVVATVIALR